MSWDPWAESARGHAGNADGAVVYSSDGAIHGRAGKFDCAGNLHLLDQKAAGKEVSAPEINGEKFMFLRVAGEDDYPVNVFKKGQNNILTAKGPSGMRFAVSIVGKKPEEAVNRLSMGIKNSI